MTHALPPDRASLQAGKVVMNAEQTEALAHEDLPVLKGKKLKFALAFAEQCFVRPEDAWKKAGFGGKYGDAYPRQAALRLMDDNPEIVKYCNILKARQWQSSLTALSQVVRINADLASDPSVHPRDRVAASKVLLKVLMPEVSRFEFSGVDGNVEVVVKLSEPQHTSDAVSNPAPDQTSTE